MRFAPGLRWSDGPAREIDPSDFYDPGYPTARAPNIEASAMTVVLRAVRHPIARTIDAWETPAIFRLQTLNLADLNFKANSARVEIPHVTSPPVAP